MWIINEEEAEAQEKLKEISFWSVYLGMNLAGIRESDTTKILWFAECTLLYFPCNYIFL